MARFNFRSFTIFIIYLWMTHAEKDFQFDNNAFIMHKDNQFTTIHNNNQYYYHEESRKPSSTQKNLYSKEISQCPYSETKIMLSLVLKSYDWNEIPKNKKTRALNKVSKFFAIPKEYIKLETSSKRDIYEMTKRSIKRGINYVENSNNLGKIEFMIGCGQTYFIMGEPISNQIGHQMKDGSIDDIIGLNFGWWVIWKKKINNRVQRFRRQVEGSGDGEYDDYDNEDYDNEDEQVTDLPVSTTHAHRHHHGVKDESMETTQNRITTPKINIQHISPSSTTENIIKPQDNEFDIEVGTTILPDVIDTTTLSRTSSIENLQPVSTTRSSPSISSTTTPVIYSTGASSSQFSSVSTTELSTSTASILSQSSTSLPTSPFTTITTTSTTIPRISTRPTTPTAIATTSTTTTSATTTVSFIPTTDYIEPEQTNNPPIIKNRLPKQPVTAGKPFSLTVPLETFYDQEDGTNLRLELLDKNGNSLKPNSWIQFNPETKEIYGLPLEDAVSRWQYKLTASDSKNESVTETLDISVQQHKGHRSVNHEITLTVKINNKFEKNIDWQIRLIRGIAEVLNDKSLSNIVVREVRQNQADTATFIYTNETLPKDKCPEEKLDDLVKRLDIKLLSESLYPDLTIKSITANPVGPCIKPHVTKFKPTPHMTKNYAPVPRNQVDRVNATIGQLLVYKVPSDTFYDPEDNTELKLSLLTINREEIKPTHWLQFDSKNQEFYGIPKYGDYGTEEYLLVAEDSGGLTANDALLVVVNHPPKRDYSILFKMTLGISYEEFNKAAVQRKFVERLAQLFGDSTTSNIQVRSIQPNNVTGHLAITFFNTTLLRSNYKCTEGELDYFRKIYFHQGHNLLRDKVKKTIGNEFHVTNVTLTPVNCHTIIDNTPHEIIPIKTEDKKRSSFPDDYLLTFILPAVIIIAMLLLASIIACVLHRRRLTGKMELGDEEERRSFRSKGIPVIFQDELDEKPEIGNKSPIILKDEKPPLLPPSYNSTNLDGDNDVDEYVPPPAVVMGGREVRGKSPVTPSYRKPPPYVSP